ncbi:P-loop containing nucleoside triphosphate hydrolase protein [Paraphysoderma sedebokerense]|nr:P-loop containing nucleoside triphosphate hydrolase protein [Paraphysoderma sedebokerense]
MTQSKPDVELHHSIAIAPHIPVTIAFKDLSYSVQIRSDVPTEGQPKRRFRRKKTVTKEKVILRDISGVFRPGKLTAILGPSGSGKTTLLNCLAGTTSSGKLDGDISINNIPVTQKQLRKLSGYVFQDDIIMSTVTVEEAIKFSLQLRTKRDGNPDKIVDEIIQELDLQKARRTVIGGDQVKGVSGGERKRTAIARELVSNPDLLFLDECTTGLDAYTAFNVIRMLKGLAAKGKTVITTLHQPSSEIFHIVDDLLILVEGEILYCGPAHNVVDYFAQLGYPCPKYTNPCDYIFMSILHESSSLPLDPTQTETFGPKLTVPELIQNYKHSQLFKQSIQTTKREVSSAVVPQAKYKSPFYIQLMYLSMRSFKNGFRNPLILQARLFQAVVLGLFISFIYIDVTDGEPNAVLQNITGALFFVAVNQFFSASFSVLGIFAAERAVFQREYISGYYSVLPFYLSKNSVEFPFNITFPIVFACISYWIIGFSSSVSTFLVYLLFAILLALCGAAFGIFVTSMFSDIGIALAIMPLVVLPLMMVCGLFANNDSTPDWINWLQWISPIQYGFTGLMKNQLQDFEVGGVSGESQLQRLGYGIFALKSSINHINH